MFKGISPLYRLSNFRQFFPNARAKNMDCFQINALFYHEQSGPELYDKIRVQIKTTEIHILLLGLTEFPLFFIKLLCNCRYFNTLHSNASFFTVAVS